MKVCIRSGGFIPPFWFCTRRGDLKVACALKIPLLRGGRLAWRGGINFVAMNYKYSTPPCGHPSRGELAQSSSVIYGATHLLNKYKRDWKLLQRRTIKPRVIQIQIQATERSLLRKTISAGSPTLRNSGGINPPLQKNKVYSPPSQNRTYMI